MITSVYVAGASAELDRCTRWISRLKEEGVKITYDWTEPVSKFGSAGHALSNSEKRAFAEADLRGVREEATLLWLLVPAVPTIGAWIELGYALRCAERDIVSCPRIFVSPPVSDRCIFGLLPAIREFPSDEEAFRAILSG